MPGERGRRTVGFGLILVLTLAILSSPSRAQQSPIAATQGQTQIIAQGVVAPPPDAAWRVVYRTIEPNAPAEIAGTGELALVDQGTLLLHDAAGTAWAALGQGEARQVPAATSLTVAALDERPAGYYEIALVAPDQRGDVGDGLPIFDSAPFAAPPGPRDLKLVRGILDPGSPTMFTAVVPEAPVLVLATLGTIDVEAGDAAPVELRVGQAVAVSGDFTVRGAGLAPASFVVAVLGRVLPDPAAGTPVASPVVTGATVSVQVHACPVGMRPGESNPNLCPSDPDAVDLRLVARPASGDEVDLGPPTITRGRAEWTDLPPGDYVLRAAGFGLAFDRFFVPGLPGLSGDAAAGYPAGAAGGYHLPITEAGASYQLDAFAFAARERMPDGTPVVRTTAVAVRQERGGEVAVRVFACPTVGLVSFDASACALATPPFAVSLQPPTDGAALTSADATPGEPGFLVWDALAPGSYVLQVPQLPAGTVAYFVLESAQVALLPDGTGYALAVAEDAPITLDLYTVGPEPVPPAPIATALPAAAATVAPTVAVAPAALDTDRDGLSDADETNLHGTNPGNWDSDGDGIGDAAELAAGTDPLTAGAPTTAAGSSDLDSDGLLDADEVATGTDPNTADTDADGWLDGNEAALGTNPLDPASFPQSP